jgi:23S rRNA (uridine2552-2'-O)-methyltransferase
MKPSITAKRGICLSRGLLPFLVSGYAEPLGRERHFCLCRMKTYRDHYFLKAKQQNYPARSVYKLKEIDAKFKLFKPGMKVLDLGAAPGSWSLAAAERVGPSGSVLACDIQTVETGFPANVRFLAADVFALPEEFEAALAKIAPFDVVMSDMAPATTGTRFRDQARSYDLCCAALGIAARSLKPDASFVVKIFMGPDIEAFLAAMRGHFASVKGFKPRSSRAESKETFYVGLGFQGPP